MADVSIENLNVQQQWPWNGLVDITYTLEDDGKGLPDEAVNVYLTFSGYDEILDKTIDIKTLSGDGAGTVVSGSPYRVVTAGKTYHAIWNAAQDYPEYASAAFTLKIEAIAGVPPYIVIDLSEGKNAESYPWRFSTAAPDVDNDDVCRTTELWLRQIPTGTFTMGSPEDEIGHYLDESQHAVTIPKMFYMGVFEVTQKQWELVMGTRPSFFSNTSFYATRPVEQISYDMIRGTGGETDVDWPQHGHDVDRNSFLGKLHDKTGFVLDLPTEAQWEYACRATTATSLNSGRNISNENRSEEINEVGRYLYNGGSDSSASSGIENGTAKVGSYAPNQWGLYDMHGNVWEWCLDWYMENHSDSTEDEHVGPVGALSGNRRSLRGGSWSGGANYCRSSYRNIGSSMLARSNYGFRLCMLPSLSSLSLVALADKPFTMSTGETEYSVLDTRTDSDGQMASGTVRISPVAATMTKNTHLELDAVVPADWTYENPFFDSTQLTDGWHAASLIEKTNSETVSLLVLNDDGIEIHGGKLQDDETWSSDKLHVVRYWTLVPEGKNLTIESGAVVKFCTGTGIRADGGTVTARGVTFTHIADDTIGGDTNHDGNASVPVSDAYEFIGFSPAYNCDRRYRTMEYNGGTVYGMVTLAGHRVNWLKGNYTIAQGGIMRVEPGAIVKFDEGVSIIVDGTFEAIGSKTQQIYFTSVKNDALYGDTNGDGDSTIPAAGDWGGFIVSGTMTMNYATITYGGNTENTGVIQGTGGITQFDNGVMEDTLHECIQTDSGTFKATNSVFRGAPLCVGNSGGNGTYLTNCVVMNMDIGCNAANTSFVNTVFYKNEQFTAQNGESSSFQNCLFYNPADYGEQSFSQVGDNGNIWGDPLFADMDNRDYTLLGASPCIDAGNGLLAPLMDWWGNPRMDVPEIEDTGIANEKGVCPDIGIHEVEGATTAATPSLLVKNVAGPLRANVGDNITVEWTTVNNGKASTKGSWRDSIVLKGMDDSLRRQQIVLGEYTNSEKLEPSASRTVSASFMLPPLKPGQWQLGVTCNAYRDVKEDQWSDNQLFAEVGLEVSLPVWSDENKQFTILGKGQTGFLVPASTADETVVEIVVSGEAHLSMYGAQDYLPSADDYERTSMLLPDGRLLMVLPAGNNAQYVTVLNHGNDDVVIDVSVNSVEFALFAATPGRILNQGSVVMRITGLGLTKKAIPVLKSEDTSITGKVIDIENGLKLTALFDVNAIPNGNYELTVTQGEASISLASNIEVFSDGTGANLEAWLESPPSVRDGHIYTAWLCYRNTGDADMPMPLFEVTCASSTKISYKADDVFSSSPLLYGGISPTAPAGILKAGEEKRLPVFFTVDGEYQISFATIASNDLGSGDGVFKTWQEYCQAMAEAATCLNARGQEEYRGFALYEQALREANGQPADAVFGVLRHKTTGEPLEGFTIRVVAVEPPVYESIAVTDEKGYFQITGLAAGNQYCIYPEGCEAEQQISIKLDGDTNLGVLKVIPWGKVTGWIRTTDNQTPLANVQVWVNGELAHCQTTTDDEGHYMTDILPPGTYDVSVESSAGYCGETHGAIDVSDGICEVDFDLQVGQILSGTLKLEDGTPVSNETIQFFNINSHQSFQCATNDEGNWTLPGIPIGTYNLSLCSGNYRLQTESQIKVEDTDNPSVLALVSTTSPDFFVLARYGAAPFSCIFGIREHAVLPDSEHIAWDFDGDGTVDSTEEMPAYIYEKPGIYTVSLTYIDKEGQEHSSTWHDCITVTEGVETIVSDMVLVLDDDSGYKVIEIFEEGLTLELTGKPKSEIKEAMILLCPASVFVRKVASVERDKQILHISTVSASLNELFEQVDMSACEEISAEETQLGDSLQSKGTSGGYTFNVGGMSYSLFGQIQPKLQLCMKKLNGKMNLEIYLAVPMIASFNAATSDNLSTGVESDAVICKIDKTFTIYIDSVPVMFDVSIPITGNLVIPPCCQAKISSMVAFNMTPRLGFSYQFGDNEYFEPFCSWQPQFGGKTENVEFDADAKVQASMDVEMDICIYDMARISISYDCNVDLFMSAADDPQSSIETSLNGNIHAFISNGSDDTCLSSTFARHSQTLEHCFLPAAQFDYSPSVDIKPGDVIQFQDNSSDASLGIKPEAWFWDFGDGTISTEQHPVHSYRSVGNYDVSLKINSGSFSYTRVCQKTINVSDNANGEKLPSGPPTGTIQGVPQASSNSNEIVGVTGLGDWATQRLVLPGEWVNYMVYFKNNASITTPVQEVQVSINWDKYLDWSTVELGEIVFNNQVELGFKGKHEGTLLVPQKNSNNYIKMQISNDPATGHFSMYLRSWDKTRQAFGYWPESDDAGFLPPDDDSHCGEGYFTVRVKVHDDAPKGKMIGCTASVTFDKNSRIETSPGWFNWIGDETIISAPGILQWDTAINSQEVAYDLEIWKGDPYRTSAAAISVYSQAGLTSGAFDLRELNLDKTETYYWQITRINEDGTESSDPVWSFELGERQTLKIRPGWNLVSLSVNPNMFSSNRLGIGFYHDGKKYTQTKEYQLGKVYWLFNRNSSRLEDILSADNSHGEIPEIEIKKGWNYIGALSENGRLLTDCSQYTVWEWRNGHFSLVCPNESNEIMLEPGRGYFIYYEPIQELDPREVPYVVIDLSGGPSATRYPWRYSKVGPENDDICRTDELWLRQIPAGVFTMGSPEDELGRKGEREGLHTVTIPGIFYIGVFEITQRQWELVMGTRPSWFSNADYYATRPVENISYEMIRGTGMTGGAGWPAYGHAVDSDSFLGRLQAKTGLVVDLPTEAQWEYACRAETGTALNSGKNLSATDQCAEMDEVGRYKFNGGSVYYAGSTTENGTAKVGSYRPNGWGLYDMHGNVMEWCLDWYIDNPAGCRYDEVVGPVGVSTGDFRVLRGGSLEYLAQNCRSAYRAPFIEPSNQHFGFGFRLCLLPNFKVQ
jgi:formylglycine-generating enzyme required for sulfatase activity/PKD repeat protein